MGGGIRRLSAEDGFSPALLSLLLSFLSPLISLLCDPAVFDLSLSFLPPSFVLYSITAFTPDG